MITPFQFIQDPKGTTNVLEVIRSGLQSLEARAHFLVPHDSAAVGPPTAGGHQKDELWVDAAYGVWRCTTAGAPGVWIQHLAGVGSVFPGGAVPVGYEFIHDGQGRSRLRWDGVSWVKGFRHVQVAEASTWAVNHGLGRFPNGITIRIGGEIWMTRVVEVDSDNIEAKFDSAQAGEITGE